jgi:hypothetical protein
MTPATAVLAASRRLRRVAQDGIHPTVDEVTAGHHHHHVHVETSRGTDAILVARHHHLVTVVMRVARHRHRVAVVTNRAATTVALHRLVPAGMMIDAMTAAAAMGDIIASPLRDMVDAATRFRGRRLGVTNVGVSVIVRRHGRAPWIVIAIVITTAIAGGMIHGTGIGIAGADAGALCGWYLYAFIQLA